jgi:hypothetical protein
MPSRSHNRSCVHAAPQPAGGDDLDLTAPGGGRGLLPGHYREIDATSRASAPRSTWSVPEVVDHLATVPGLRVCYLVEYAGSSPAQESQLPWGNSSTSAIGRTTGAQAEHIGTKLAEIDAVIVPAAPDLPRSRSPRDAGRRRMLARMEHDR